MGWYHRHAMAGEVRETFVPMPHLLLFKPALVR
jgi:hypothetical protein